NAPITKSLIFIISSTSVLSSLLKIKGWFWVYLHPSLLRDWQFHRLILSPLVFSTSGELLVGGILFYHLRVLERIFGSSKYASFLFISTALSSALELGLMVLLRRWGLSEVPSGPFATLVSALYIYDQHIPELYKFRILGITLTDKSFLFLFAINLLSLHSPHTIIPLISGLLSASLYKSDITNFKSWRFPNWIIRIAKSFEPWIGSQTPPRRGGDVERLPPSRADNNAGTATSRSSGTSTGVSSGSSVTQRSSGSGAANGSGNGAGVVSPVEINEESVSMLVNMGFDRARVIECLNRVNGDVERAVGMLVE
ncbi:hypothetical protein BKA69DRAFT_1033867, partial [Paraphysoderma sedebokerense]